MRGTVSALLTIGAAGLLAGVAHATPAGSRVQPLVTMLAGRTAHVAPADGSRVVASLAAKTRITGIQRVLPLLGTRPGGWLHVALPGRPNGRSGWMRAASTRRGQTAWRLAVDLSRRRLTVYRLGHVVRSFLAVVGKPSTPTPTGTFFVEEPVRLGSSGVGGPYALALSARSTVLQEFDGGPGQIAIHGRDNIGGVLGTAASHGCVRVDDRAIRWLVGRVGAGTPVTIAN